MDIAFLIVGGVWTLFTVGALFGARALRELPDVDDEPAPRPSVSVIVPARDEANRVERTVRDLLAQRGVDMQLILVDDRSTDGTTEILRRLSSDERLKVLRVDEVPDGWLGKCHACSVGAAVATGDWLLFTDADAWARGDLVMRAIERACVEELDHLCLAPALGRCSLFGKATVLLAMMGLLGLVFAVNRKSPKTYVGVGAFNLVRREAYEAIGGHRRLRLEVIDDFALAYLLRCDQRRSRIFAAFDSLEVRWAHSVGSYVEVLEKNMFAKLNYSFAATTIYVLGTLTLFAMPLLGAWFATTAGWFAFLAMFAMAIPAGIVARRMSWSFAVGLLCPLSTPVHGLAALCSAYRAKRQGGVRWRETLYPLELLRRGSIHSDP